MLYDTQNYKTVTIISHSRGPSKLAQSSLSVRKMRSYGWVYHLGDSFKDTIHYILGGVSNQDIGPLRIYRRRGTLLQYHKYWRKKEMKII
jgi:hypothetical protein